VEPPEPVPPVPGIPPKGPDTEKEEETSEVRGPVQIPQPPVPPQTPEVITAVGIPFAFTREEVPDRVKKQRKIFGQEEVVVEVKPVYRLLLELGISAKSGLLTKTHQTRYMVMDAATGMSVALGSRMVFEPGLEGLLGLDSRDVQVLRNLRDDRYTSAVEVASKMKLPEDLVRDNLRELEGRRLAKSSRVGNTKVYQRIVNLPSLDLAETRANLSPLQPPEIIPPPGGRSEAELREAIRGLRDDYDLVVYQPFYYPLYSVTLALGNRTRTILIDGVSAEETRV